MCTVTCSSTIKSELEEMVEKNNELELELKRLRKDVFYYPATEAAAEDPEIAELLSNNRAWVQRHIVSYCSGHPER